MELYLGTTYYGSRFFLDGFIVLDIDKYVLSSTNDSYYSLMNTSRNACDNVIIWLARENLLGQFTKIDMLNCEYCLVDKTTRKPFGNGTRTKIPLQLICFDICGLMSVRARYRVLYFVTFIDDFTCYGHVYMISHKS